jgi:lipopolysaccharide transport system permease protein
LIKKVYFPRLAIPISAVLAGLVDFLLAFAVMLGMLGYYHWRGIFAFAPSSNLLFLPLFALLALASALTVGLWLSALNVQYRDIRYTLPFLTQFWLFATPIAYPSSLVPEKWQALYGLNPMAGVVEGFRWALFGTTDMAFDLVMVSTAIVIVFLWGGLVYFRRMERTFADIV